MEDLTADSVCRLLDMRLASVQEVHRRAPAPSIGRIAIALVPHRNDQRIAVLVEHRHQAGRNGSAADAVDMANATGITCREMFSSPLTICRGSARFGRSLQAQFQALTRTNLNCSAWISGAMAAA